ncbi:TlpA disulfide reductase family protein [Tenacibaculum sp. FZY0031]|uniref:TlpA family protein disulfide reductase n=1 Tax=Tenacibaculum sp. FZY0031 TaxID=3116648 RepID=UPI002EAF9DAD|nr:TlpA disulfide reductase family protein [Tenacibaculum sp. FZY0031]
MRDIIPTLLSIGVGFAISFFGLDFYSDSLKNENKIIAQSNEVTAPIETVETSSKEEALPKPVSENDMPKEAMTAEEPSTGATSIDVEDIQKSFDNWEAYTKENIDLMATFTPLDNEGTAMEKGIFLTLLRTGAYIPIKSEKDGKLQYQLTNIDESADEKIKKSIVSKASIAHQYFKMEGKKLPNYNFVDLKGKAHNKADTKGKLLVLKCWFITCKVCVEEFPELNELVDKYKDDKIEFVSLAFDKKNELVEFLETKEFKYPTIPEQKDYMAKKLKVKQYPTHLIVDANGVIIKMVSNVKTLTSELKRIMGK